MAAFFGFKKSLNTHCYQQGCGETFQRALVVPPKTYKEI